MIVSGVPETARRLPVVHPQLVDLVSEPQLVDALDLRHVARNRVRPLVAFHGIPSVEVADSREAAPAAALVTDQRPTTRPAHEEPREAAVATIAGEVGPTVHAWNPEDLPPVVAQCDVALLRRLRHPGDPERRIEDRGGVDGPRVAKRVLLDGRFARERPVVPEVRLRRRYVGPHSRVLAPHLVRGRVVVIDLEVVVVPVEPPILLAHEVPANRHTPDVPAGGAGSRDVDVGIQGLDLLGDRADQRRGDPIARGRFTAGAVRIARKRVVDDLQAAVPVERLAESPARNAAGGTS